MHSLSYGGKQCFRSPSLSTYWFCVDWKQSKHVWKIQFFGAWKIVFLQNLSFLQVIGENNVSGPQHSPSLPTYSFCVDWMQSKHVWKIQFVGAWKNVFLQSPISSHKTIRGHTTKKNRKGELQTSRVNSSLRIWQPYSRVPQIVKVLCGWYGWKYVARLGFEPFKFLYSEFLYNTQTVISQLVFWFISLDRTVRSGVWLWHYGKASRDASGSLEDEEAGSV